MLLVATPDLQRLARVAPQAPPTPRERLLTWATIVLFLTVFWFGVAVAADALWSSYAG